MRRTNKKLSKLADEKKGVILVTIIFIVAMALLFITTALTISISSRTRVYANAKNDQARLTVTSLAQSIWQAIYSQQIRDVELIALAQSGSVVRFTNPNIPGMVNGSPAEATAYFYTISTDADGNPDKIGIECKCDIDGEVQYYRLVLEKNIGEGIPAAMFDLTVEIGRGGLLNSCNFGIVGSNTNGYNNQRRYDSPDNVAFIHGSTTSSQDNNGIYSTLLCDGPLYLSDACFGASVYMIGEDASINFPTRPQFTATSDHTADHNIYFWGTTTPFTNAPTGTALNAVRNYPLTNLSGDWGTANLSGVDNIYFDMRDMGEGASPRYVGFSGNTTNYNHNVSISGDWYYERGAMSSATHNAEGTWHEGAVGTEYVSGISSYLTVDPGLLDTTGEVVAQYVTPYYGGTDMEELDTTGATTLTAGSYVVSTATEINKVIKCNVSGGDIYIFLDASITIKSNGGNAGFEIEASCTTEHNVFIILRNTAAVTLQGGNGGTWTGICDRRCFTGDPTDGRNLDQTKVPRFYLFSTHTGGRQLYWASNGNEVLSANVGLFPSTTRGTDGGTMEIYNSNASKVFYGRICCGSIDTGTTGGNFNIPYCPSTPGGLPLREEAYRDNTNFSVVTEECMFYTA